MLYGHQRRFEDCDLNGLYSTVRVRKLDPENEKDDGLAMTRELRFFEYAVGDDKAAARYLGRAPTIHDTNMRRSALAGLPKYTAMWVTGMRLAIDTAAPAALLEWFSGAIAEIRYAGGLQARVFGRDLVARRQHDLDFPGRDRCDLSRKDVVDIINQRPEARATVDRFPVFDMRENLRFEVTITNAHDHQGWAFLLSRGASADVRLHLDGIIVNVP